MTTQINPATQIANGTLPAGVIAASAAPVSYSQTVSISANTVLTAAQSGTVFVTRGALTVTLPVPALGLKYRVYGCPIGLVTIQHNATESIYFPDGSFTASFAMSLNNLGFIDLICDGANWMSWTTGRTIVTNAVSPNEAVSLGQVNGLYQPARTPNVTPVQNGTGISVSANHTLGYVPFFVSFEYVNLVAEHGFSVGDVAECISQWNGTTGGELQNYKTSKIVGIQCIAGFTPQLSAKSGGAGFTPIAANWAYRFSVR